MVQLSEILPNFVAEVAAALDDEGHAELAKAFRNVEIVERCHCREPGCVTFHAIPKAISPKPAECDVVVPLVRGVSWLQHHHGKVVSFEALGRPEERRILNEYWPIGASPNKSLERTRDR